MKIRDMLVTGVLLLGLQLPAEAGRKAVVSWYGEPQRTAMGKQFNPHGMTAAHKSLPFGTRVRIVNPKTKRSVVVTINDRGPYIGGRTFDLSYGAARKLGIVSQGVGTVKYQILGK